MAKITAKDVAKLRKMTGAGMMDCKKALQETDGNFTEAIEALRKKGQKVANKRADKEATEGVVLAKKTEDGKFGVIISLSCETDFVAKTERYVELSNSILNIALQKKPANLEELKNTKIGERTVLEEIIFATGIIGEKMELIYYDKIEAQDIALYIHQDKKISSIAGFNKAGIDEQVGKDIVMQITSMNPVALDKDFVTQEVIDKELEIGKELAINEGKPPALAEQIAKGRLNKFFKESTLLNQAFIKDNKQTIKQYLKSIDKELTVTIFKRYSIRD